MSNSRYYILGNFLILLLMVGFTSCKSTESTQDANTEVNETDTAEMEKIFWARIDSAKMNFSEKDVEFMTGMIGHHAQALIISRLAPENNASSEIKVLASRIINAQKDEIESMQRWLREREQPVPEIHIDGLNLMIHGVEGHHANHHQNMPGMLSQEQIEELSEAEGEDFNRLYLTYMIEHHEGAVLMVKDLFDTDGAALEDTAFRLASDIQVDQITEIERMKLMLSRLSDSEE